MNITLSTYDHHHSLEQLIDLLSLIKFTNTNCWLWSTITNLECRSNYSQKVDEANLSSCNLHPAGQCQHRALQCLHPLHGSRRNTTGSSSAWCEMWCIGWQQGEGLCHCPQTPESGWMLLLRVEDKADEISIKMVRMGMRVHMAWLRAQYSPSWVLRVMVDWSWDFHTRGQPPRVMMYPVHNLVVDGSWSGLTR